MFALIKREIRDNLLFILISMLLSVVLVLIAFWFAYTENQLKAVPVGLSIPVIVIATLGFCAMGSSQMYADKNKKLSGFICTRATTRRQILIDRIITGLITILILIFPVFVTTKFLLRLLVPPVPIYGSMVRDISFTGFLAVLSCYCIGLQTGWSSNKLFPTFGAIILTITLLPLVIVKGLGLHIWVLLTLFIIASLVRTWNKFMTAALI